MATVDLFNDDSDNPYRAPRPPRANTPTAEPYTNWDDERAWALPRFRQHVQSKPFLYGKVKDEDYENAFQIYNTFRPNFPNRGDAYNRTLDRLGWWTGQRTDVPSPGSLYPDYSGGKDYKSLINWWQSQNQASNPNMEGLVNWLGQHGTTGTRARHGVNNSEISDDKIVIGGQMFDLGSSLGAPDARWFTDFGPMGPGGDFTSPQATQFSDPLTQQYEKLLQGQTQMLQQQQQRMQQETAQQEQVRQQTAEAVKRLTEFVNQRATKLQQPAYTDSEANILKTRLLDPIERDRTAAQKRALENIGSRGFDPSSGIAQELIGLVDRGYDEQRTQAHGDIAEQQILEERDRQREAQELIAYLTHLPQAAARGDLDFVNYLHSLVNQPGQNALATSAMLSDLPYRALQAGSQVLGLGGSPQSSVPNVLDLLNNAQRDRYINQSQNNDFWLNLGKDIYGSIFK